ncbi:MAG: hypothetical protein JWO30_3445 [Fibrobacteres bacterium]|nr:hypothetical protein [Fibrobacterota bacterium]
MLIESAFLKLPELLLSSHNHRGNVEAMVVHHLVTGLQMELNSRSIPFAYNHITVEVPYPKQSRIGSVFRADLLFDSNGSIPSIARLDQYGFKEKQWVEAKGYFSKGKTTPATTQNIGRVIKDIIRLCLLPEELQGGIRQNGRYVLLVFDKHPGKYLAYSNREWLRRIFEDRTPSIKINLESEKTSLIQSIVGQSNLNSQMELSLSILHFEPSTEIPFPVYWGYLLRIDKFSISINNKVITSSGEVQERWDRDKVLALEAVRNEFANLLGKDEGDIPVV